MCSDGTLNPGGVRFGSAELYNVVGNFSEVADSLVVGQKMGEDERVVMFLIPAKGHSITPELIKKINLSIRQQLSPRHVPAITLPTLEIPVSAHGKHHYFFFFANVLSLILILFIIFGSIR